MARFCVIIPLYNKESHIEQALLSVLNQSFEDFEVVVVNDGSTDNSVSNISHIVDPRVKIVSQENQGVSAARNNGIEIASSDFIAFLDADDYWYPWHLDELNSLININDELGLYTVAHEILQDGNRYLPARPFSPEFKGVVEDFFLAYSKSLALSNSSKVSLPRSLLIDIGGFPEGVKKGEDVYVWLRAALGKGVAYSSRVCVCVNRDAECRSNLDSSSELPYYLYWLDDLIERGMLDRRHLNSAIKFLQVGLFFNAFGYKMAGNLAGLDRFKELNISKRFKVKVFLFMLNIIPSGILVFAKRFRHARL